TATSITNNLYMTSGAQTLNNLTLNPTAGQVLTLGSDLTVSGAYTQTKGIVNINGHTLTLSGAVTFASSVANGTTTGSTTSNLIINATTIAANSLFMTVGSQTLNNLTLNSAGQTLTLGTALTVSGAYTQINGIVKLNAQTLTLTGAVTFPAASSNGTITGSTTSNLSVSGTSITNTLFFTTGALTLNNFTVNSAGQTLKLGTALTLSGTFTHTNGIIDLNGQTLTCNGPVVFPVSVTNGSFTGSSSSSFSITTAAGGAITNSMYMTQTNSSTNSLKNLTLVRTGGTLTLGNQLNLIGALTPTTGTVACGGNLTLVASSATLTAYIGTIGGSVTGNVTVQVYEAGPTTGWTLMGSPGLTGRTMADWNNSFFITCPVCPDGDGTAQNGSAFTSIDVYSETAGGLISDAARYIGITNITNAINVGQGYWVYLGNGASTTSDIIVSMTGPVKQGNVSLPLTITNTGAGTAATDHGYNLLANPYPAPISWASLRAGNANVSATMYVYNPDLNGYASYISTSGVSSPAVGSGGIGDKIPAGQGFYVKASAATTLTAKETYKAASNQQLLRTNVNYQPQQTASTSPQALFRLQASGNSMNNETVIYFDPNATSYYNADYDAISLGVDPGFLGIVSDISDTLYTIKGLPPLTQNLSIPIKTITGITGSYQIAATDLQNIPSGACIKLHDKYLNTDWDLRTGAYNCTLNDTETVARFILNITIDPSLSVSGNSQNPTCTSSANGYMIASASGPAPWNYYWKDANNNIIKTSLNKTTPDTLLNANGGNYSVDINTVGSCNNGTINFTLQGTMSANSLFTPSTTLDSLTNDTVSIYFANYSTNASSYLWDFGDGTQSNVNSIYHTYTSPGTYTVALAAYDQACGDTSVSYQTVVIDTASTSSTSGIKSITALQNTMQISRDAGGYYVQFNYQTKTNATISVQNLLGEKVVADIKQENVANNKTYISLGNAGNNVLIISVNTGSGEKIFKKVINY
ncbi:MAG TPA: PKD domain-containing protein, partial [Bacteroidia bacterium]|nr:PKD domain-containing protein [Bacteroidia bacterium]